PGASEPAWIDRAREVSLRRLEDEIAFLVHLRETRPGIASLLDGGPLPAGIALVPGRSPRLSASAPRGSRAAAFLKAIEDDETLAPFPPRMCRMQMLVEASVHRAWDDTVAHCRSAVRSELREWEALALVLREFWRTWDNAETRSQRRQNP